MKKKLGEASMHSRLRAYRLSNLDSCRVGVQKILRTLLAGCEPSRCVSLRGMSRASASDLQDPPARPPFMLLAAHRAPVEQALADEPCPSGGCFPLRTHNCMGRV